MLDSQNVNQKSLCKYTINDSDKVVTICDAGSKFDGVKISFTNFNMVADPYKNDELLISYDYNIVEGDVGIDEGEEIKNIMRSIINDIITTFEDKEE